jgi:hypothetical protein
MKAATINGESSAMFSLLCQGFPSSFPNMLLQNASAACHLFGCVSSFCLSFFLRRRLIYVGFEGDLRKREKLWHCVHFSSFFSERRFAENSFPFYSLQIPSSLTIQTNCSLGFDATGRRVRGASTQPGMEKVGGGRRKTET